MGSLTVLVLSGLEGWHVTTWCVLDYCWWFEIEVSEAWLIIKFQIHGTWCPGVAEEFAGLIGPLLLRSDPHNVQQECGLKSLSFQICIFTTALSHYLITTHSWKWMLSIWCVGTCHSSLSKCEVTVFCLLLAFAAQKEILTNRSICQLWIPGLFWQWRFQGSYWFCWWMLWRSTVLGRSRWRVFFQTSRPCRLTERACHATFLTSKTILRRASGFRFIESAKIANAILDLLVESEWCLMEIEYIIMTLFAAAQFVNQILRFELEWCLMDWVHYGCSPVCQIIRLELLNLNLAWLGSCISQSTVSLSVIQSL